MRNDEKDACRRQTNRTRLIKTVNNARERTREMLFKSNLHLEELLRLQEHISNMNVLLADLEAIKSALRTGEQGVLPVGLLREHYDELRRSVASLKTNPPGSARVRTPAVPEREALPGAPGLRAAPDAPLTNETAGLACSS